MTDRNANRPGYKKTPVGWIPEVGRPFLADPVRQECLTYIGARAG